MLKTSSRAVSRSRRILSIQSPGSFSVSSEKTRNSISSDLYFDDATYGDLLRSFTRRKKLVHGKLIHCHMIKVSFRNSLFLDNTLLNMYCKCGDQEFARHLFDRMTERNIVSWNSLISGYSTMGCYQKAFSLFLRGKSVGIEPDRFTYAGILRASAQSGEKKMCMIIHTQIIVTGLSFHVLLTNTLIDVYAKCGCPDVASLVFDHAEELDLVSWNSLISGYVHLHLVDRSFEIFSQMHRKGVCINGFALGSIFNACTEPTAYSSDFGSITHCLAVKFGLDMDVVVCGSMLDMFLKHGALDEAIKTFKLMPEKNVVIFNTMISGLCGPALATPGKPYFAVNLFSLMERRGGYLSKFTFSSMLKACNLISNFELGKQIHAKVLKHNLQNDEFIVSGLIDLYAYHGLIGDGFKCFDSTSKKDVVSWTSMISGFLQSEQFDQACYLFHKLLASGLQPDEFALSSATSACANLSLLRTGEQIHGRSVKGGFGHFTVFVNSLIFMYAKSGDIDAAVKVFQETSNRDVVTWSAMICCYAQYGFADIALKLFAKMKDSGFVPNSVTFLGVLAACSHGGLVEEGSRSFDSMKRDYNLEPNAKHYAAMVDLLGRAGKLSEAEDLIVSSGFDFDPVIWKALLGSCRLHADVTRAAQVAKKVSELDPSESSSYVLLYNIYLNAGEKSLADNTRNQMKRLGVKKEPGLSWIVIGAKVHSFSASCKSHSRSEEIYLKLKDLIYNMKNVVEDEVVENFHSERLAVVLGMMDLPKSAPIRVMKNLRICGDCHTFMKLLSSRERREIVLRDPFRFHRIIGGLCSCGDYW